MTSAGAAPAPRLLAPEHRRLIVGAFLVSTFIAFEMMSVATVLPAVVKHIGGLDLYGWAFSAFMLTELVGIVAAGRVIDRVGCAGPLVVSGALFCAGLLIDGTASSMAVLVLGRAVQGLGAGTITVISNAAVGRSLPPALRPKGYAALAMAWVLPSIVGPAIAGLAAQLATWRLVFLGVVPLVLIGIVIAVPALRESDRRHRERYEPTAEGARVRTLAVTAAALTAGAASVLEATTNQTIFVAVVSGGLGLGCLAFALRRTLPRGGTPLATRQRAAAWTAALTAAAFFGVEALLPLTITTLHHRSLIEAGAVLTTAAFTWTLGSALQARLTNQVSPRALSVAAVVLIAAGVFTALSLDWASTPWWLGFLAWSLAPAGMGILNPLTSILVLGGEDGIFGAPLAALQLLMTLGTAIGTGLAGAALAWSHRSGHGTVPGLRILDAFAVLVALGALAFAARLPRALHIIADRPVTCEHAGH